MIEVVILDYLRPGVTRPHVDGFQAKLIPSHGTCVSYFSSYCEESTGQEKLKEGSKVGFILVHTVRVYSSMLGKAWYRIVRQLVILLP